MTPLRDNNGKKIQIKNGFGTNSINITEDCGIN